MLDPFLRPVMHRLLAPIAARMRGVPPNWLSAGSTFAGLAAAGLLLLPSSAAALALWGLSRILDGLDGAVARAAGKQSDFGGYIDILGDFVVYAAIPAAVVIGSGGERPALIVLTLLLSSFYVNAASWMYLSALLERRGAGAAARGEVTSVTMPDALVGGTETLVLLSLALVAPRHATEIFALMTVLVLISIVQRVVWARRNLR